MSKKLTTKEIKERMYELVGSDYELLSEYVNARTKVKIKHVACDYEYETLWNNFKSGCRCPKCNGNYQYTDSEISKLVSEMTDGEYIKLSEYKNNYTTFSIRHNKCNFEYEVRWKDFQKGHRCPKCARDARKYTDTEINNFIHEMTNGEYTKLSVYVNSATKFKIRHEKCNFEYMVRWNDFQRGIRCPRCNQSKGEKFIQDYLTSQGISFATQVRFKDCKYINTLPFDCGIIDDNKRIVALIEFDGQQHYESVSFFGGEEALQQTQLRDSIKNEYCAKNKIPLLRIRFDEDIEEKLSLFLYKLKGSKRE